MSTHQDDTPGRTYAAASSPKHGLGPGSAGQSGDTQGLSDEAEAGPQSVEELAEEGQALEAELIAGLEDDHGDEVKEVHTRQVPVDDVPSEYLEETD